ncbi:hypothetical protein [Campylobacter lanienae]|uniref:hypothetical protein n=1 Tax=Campylobacter lanienae TaxID=75658 RepID=UPI00112FA44F|nr:hypothetical protein [Campylobacter lanienae]
MAVYYQPLAPATFYHCQIPLPNSAVVFKNATYKEPIPPPHPKMPPTKIRHPTLKTLHKKPNLTPQKPNFISIRTKSD